MNEEMSGSTIPRRQLGRHLRDLRLRAGFGVKPACHQLEISEAKLWRIESGKTSVRSIEVEHMCRTYGAPSEDMEALVALARETKVKGWWPCYGGVIRGGTASTRVWSLRPPASQRTNPSS